MDRHVIEKLQNQFDALGNQVPDEDVEFWFARDVKEPLGYAKWERFKDTIHRAIISCETTGYGPNNHFRGVTKRPSQADDAELKCYLGSMKKA